LEPLKIIINNKLENKFHQQDLGLSTFLVTGGAGFIGGHIAEYLLKNGAGKVRY
jgi:UDP-N-acetylglucosamine 4-epimerase